LIELSGGTKCRIGYVAALLILVSPISVVSAYLIETSPYTNSWCGWSTALGGVRTAVRCLLYTQGYEGTVNFVAAGIFQRITTQNRTGGSEIVFTLRTNEDRLLRLLFYCRDGILVTTADRQRGGVEVVSGYSFCENVPLEDGLYISVRGTLITPSQWRIDESRPILVFTGDLYVIDAA
jgi:hypothetical protein